MNIPELRPPSSEPSNSGKIWLFRLLASGVPLLIGLVVIGWLLVRQGRLDFEDGIQLKAAPFYLQEEGHERSGHKYLYDPQLGWRNIPNWKASTFGKPLTTNSKGLRDRPYAFAKSVGARRILVLGDSFTWGYGVGDDEIFTEVLESRLAEESKAAIQSETSQANANQLTNRPTWEVLNTGVSGWGTDQEYLYFQQEGKRYAPDIVILACYLGNDPNNCVNKTNYGLHKPYFSDAKLTLANVPVPKPTPGTDGAATDAKQALSARGSLVEQNTLCARIIEALADECDEVGAVLVLMKFGVFQRPESNSVQVANAAFLGKVVRIQDRLRYLDLDVHFGQRALGRLALTEGVDDGHWNPFGHQQVAEILHAFLAEQSLLDARD